MEDVLKVLLPRNDGNQVANDRVFLVVESVEDWFDQDAVRVQLLAVLASQGFGSEHVGGVGNLRENGTPGDAGCRNNVGDQRIGQQVEVDEGFLERWRGLLPDRRILVLLGRWDERAILGLFKNGLVDWLGLRVRSNPRVVAELERLRNPLLMGRGVVGPFREVVVRYQRSIGQQPCAGHLPEALASDFEVRQRDEGEVVIGAAMVDESVGGHDAAEAGDQVQSRLQIVLRHILDLARVVVVLKDKVGMLTLSCEVVSEERRGGGRHKEDGEHANLREQHDLGFAVVGDFVLAATEVLVASRVVAACRACRGVVVRSAGAVLVSVGRSAPEAGDAAAVVGVIVRDGG
mmetsp:Transcript_12210/g.35412  ORF Transcript_12210/g.35412 Transcript_12210/m.35412 type:complete len:347 (+) Transcript_12210:2755-3795(+)